MVRCSPRGAGGLLVAMVCCVQATAARCQDRDLKKFYDGPDGKWQCNEKKDGSGQYPDDTVCRVVARDKQKDECQLTVRCKKRDGWTVIGKRPKNVCTRIGGGSGNTPSPNGPVMCSGLIRPDIPSPSYATWDELDIDCSMAVNPGDKCQLTSRAFFLADTLTCQGQVICNPSGKYENQGFICGCNIPSVPLTSEFGLCIKRRSFSGTTIMVPDTRCNVSVEDMRKYVPNNPECADEDRIITCTKGLDLTCARAPAHPPYTYLPSRKALVDHIDFFCLASPLMAGMPCPYEARPGVKCAGTAMVSALNTIDLTGVDCGCDPSYVRAHYGGFERAGADLCELSDGYIAEGDECGGKRGSSDCSIIKCADFALSSEDLQCGTLSGTTDAPDTPAPATPAPSSDAPDTDVPLTQPPPTDAPDTTAPLTPPTDAPSTGIPETAAPATDAPATEAPKTSAPTTVSTDAPSTDTPAVAPVTPAPETPNPETPAPITDVPSTTSPTAPVSPAPETAEPTTAPVAPKTDAPVTLTPETGAPATTSPPTDAPTTASPGLPVTTAPTQSPQTDVPTTATTVSPSTLTPATVAPGAVSPTSSPTVPSPACTDACECSGLKCLAKQTCAVRRYEPQCVKPRPPVDRCATKVCPALRECKVVNMKAVCVDAPSPPQTCTNPKRICEADTCEPTERCVPDHTCGARCVPDKCQEFVWPPEEGVCHTSADCNDGETCPVQGASSLSGALSQWCECNPKTGAAGRCSKSVFPDLRRCIPKKWDCVGNSSSSIVTLTPADALMRDLWCCEHLQMNCRGTGAGLQYNCEAVGTEGPESWSDEKKAFCCTTAGIGCVTLGGYDCGSAERWSYPKRRYCCEQEQIGCPIDPYSCDGTPADRSQWSAQQSEFCCSTRSIGCKAAPAVFDCSSGGLWTHEKRDYCCWRYGLQCRDNKPRYDCWSSSSIGNWTAQQSQYCCRTASRGCRPDSDLEGPFNCMDMVARPDHVREWCCQNEDEGCVSTLPTQTKCNTKPTDAAAQDECCEAEEKFCRYQCHLPDTFLERSGWGTAQLEFCCRLKGVGCVLRNDNTMKVDPSSDKLTFGGRQWEQFEIAYRGVWEDIEENPRRYVTILLTTLKYALRTKFPADSEFEFFLQLLGPIELLANASGLTPLYPAAGSDISKQAMLIPRDWHPTTTTGTTTRRTAAASRTGITLGSDSDGDSNSDLPTDRGVMARFTLDGDSENFVEYRDALRSLLEESESHNGALASNNMGETYRVSSLGPMRSTGLVSSAAPPAGEEEASSMLPVILGSLGGLCIGAVAAGYIVSVHRKRNDRTFDSAGGLEAELTEWHPQDYDMTSHYNAGNAQQDDESRKVIETGTI